MTHNILDHDTQKIMYRSAVRPKKSSTPNHRLAPHGGEVSASSDPSEDKISSGSPLGSSEGSSDAMTHNILDHDTQKIIYRSAVRPKKSSTPNHRLAPHGGEVSASSDPSEDKISSGSPLGSSEGSSPDRRTPQSSSGPEMKRIHLDPSLCLHLTLVTSLVGLSYFHLRRMGRGIEPRLPDRLLKSLTRTIVKG